LKNLNFIAVSALLLMVFAGWSIVCADVPVPAVKFVNRKSIPRTCAPAYPDGQNYEDDAEHCRDEK